MTKPACDVFISYSRQDMVFVEQLDQDLQQMGISSYRDLSEMPPAAQVEADIYAAIDASAKFIFVMRPDSLASEWCGRELHYARSTRKPVIPILHRDLDMKRTEREIGLERVIAAEDRTELKGTNWV